MIAEPFKRSKIFVNRGIQGSMALRFGMYWVVYHICLWHGAFMYFFLRARLSLLTGGEGPMMSVSELYGKFMADYLPITVTALLLLPIVVYEMIRQTHRIAGPLVRFSNALQDMKDGKVIQPVKLREGDMLTDFETLFNEFVEFHQAKSKAGESKLTGSAEVKPERQLVASNAD